MFASQYNERDLKNFMTAHELMLVAMHWMRPRKKFRDLTDADIRELIHWLGIMSADTIYTQDDFPHIRRWGIGVMVSVALLAFPDFYAQHELWQVN